MSEDIKAKLRDLETRRKALEGKKDKIYREMVSLETDRDKSIKELESLGYTIKGKKVSELNELLTEIENNLVTKSKELEEKVRMGEDLLEQLENM